MSIAMVNRPPVAIYREDQWFSPWIYAALTGLASLAIGLVLWSEGPGRLAHVGLSALRSPEWSLVLMLGLSLPPVLVVGLLRMTTEVDPAELRLWFGLVPTYRHVVPIDAIQSVEPVRYRPLLDCGGWGIRRSPSGDRVFSARGDRGVRLTLHDGSTLLIGSQRPDELARVLNRAVRDLS